MAKLRNWAGNLEYNAARLHTPHTVEQIQEIVQRGGTLKVLGTRHSFNDIADTMGDLISLEHLTQVTELNPDPRFPTVTVEAGITYGQLSRFLHSEGYALHNLASLPHISIAGACATATHGSGDGNSNLATAVSAIEFVDGSGEVKTLSRQQQGETFPGAVVGLGGLGVVTKLTLDLIPTFTVRQEVYENLPAAQLEEHFDDIESSAYSVSLFTDWRSAHFNQVWFKRRVTEADTSGLPIERYGATLATRPMHPLANLPAHNCTEQGGVPGPWHERLPHFRMEFMPSAGEELQSEYFVPRTHAMNALRAIYAVRESVSPLLQISEIRTIRKDDLWMSPCYQQDSVGIHFTWLKDWDAVQNVLPKIEAQLAPFQARPHWGKVFTMPPAQLKSLYERLPDFQNLLALYDPEGKFRNAFLDTYLY